VKDQITMNFVPSPTTTPKKSLSRSFHHHQRQRSRSESNGSPRHSKSDSTAQEVEMSFCDILNTCMNDDEDTIKEKVENVRLAQETFDKAIRDASVSFRQLRRLEKLETQTNERLSCGVEIIDERFDKIVNALNKRREELKKDMENGQKRQLEAVHRCKCELKSLHYQCRAAEMASRRALRSANFEMFMEQHSDFAWRSAIGDATRTRTKSEILRMERKYALCVTFPDDAESRLLSTIRGLGEITVRGVPPALLTASVRFNLHLNFLTYFFPVSPQTSLYIYNRYISNTFYVSQHHPN